MRTSHRPGATPGKSRTGASPRLLLAACGVVAIAIGGVVAASIPASLPILAVNQGQGQLALSDIEIDRLGNPQEPALRVSGRITNTSDRPMPLVGVDFIVTSSTNSDSTSDIPQGWRHQPARDQLQPGQSILFSSAAGGIPALASPSFTNPSLANRVEIRVGETRLQQEF